jgi:hypothetical protein
MLTKPCLKLIRDSHLINLINLVYSKLVKLSNLIHLSEVGSSTPASADGIPSHEKSHLPGQTRVSTQFLGEKKLR